MGIYLNIGNEGFVSARNSEYVDKSRLISIVNSTLNTERRYSCVSRCRRFGKSLAAKMLAAYYDESCNSRSLFTDLEIARDPSFEKYLNKFPVIYLDMSSFTPRFHEQEESIVTFIEKEIRDDVLLQFADVAVRKEDDLMNVLTRIAQAHHRKFILIIDEWDAICREFRPGTKAMDNYVNWLRRMFKSANAASTFAAVYMTGILPIKKYKTESALNNFTEYSMVNPGAMAPCFGFTKQEVRALCEKHDMDFDDMVKWYDGYHIGNEHSMFNPNSVMMALWEHRCHSFWAATGAYDAIATYAQMNFEGLKDDIIAMLAGAHIRVNTTKFENDMSIVRSKDDVLTVLIHLGYLAYDADTRRCYVPNLEVSGEMSNAVEDTKWTNVVKALQDSEQLLDDTLAGNAEAVARGVDIAHDENTSILSYDDENSLACVLSIAFFSAKSDYIIHREPASGKGFADLVFIPRKNVSKPAMVIELKCDKDADAAIDQIKRKQYPAKLAEYTGQTLLVGINYNRKTKTHSCQIEKMQ